MQYRCPVSQSLRAFRNDPGASVRLLLKVLLAVRRLPLRLTERDVVVIPKSVRPERMAQNLEVFDFELKGDEINLIRPGKNSCAFSA